MKGGLRRACRCGFLGAGVCLLVVVYFPPAVFAATYTVSKTADTNDGTCNADCSLREAITAANGGAGNVVEFNINGGVDGGCTGAGGVCTIAPTSGGFGALPSITQANTTINGYTQNGAFVNTTNFPNPLDSILCRYVFFHARSPSFVGVRVNAFHKNDHFTDS